MKPDLVHWVRSSLFIKVLLMILIVYIAVTWTSIETHHLIFRHHRFEKKMENTVNFCNFIIDEIGAPPDTIRAAELAGRLNIQMRIVSEELTWESTREMPLFDGEKLSPFRDSNVHVGFDRGIQAQIFRDGARYEFLLQRRRESMPYAAELQMGLHIIYTAIMLLLIYLGLRWQQRPLGVLHHAVQRVAAGDLDFEIDSSRRDELGVLVRSFNAMRAEIVAMIEGREQLLLDVSHEFRSPLTRMKVSLEMMEESEERNNLIEDINELEAMVTELLEGARIQSPHGELDLREIDLRDPLERVRRELGERPPGILLRPGDEAVRLVVDPARIRILFKNIIANAVKYTPPGGPPVEVTLEGAANAVTVTVRDHGCGIPENELPHIFEPFYRVDKSRSKGTGGYGLGMHLSKRIMDAHGGEITVTSRVNEGTTVLLRFPRPSDTTPR